MRAGSVRSAASRGASARSGAVRGRSASSRIGSGNGRAASTRLGSGRSTSTRLGAHGSTVPRHARGASPKPRRATGGNVRDSLAGAGKVSLSPLSSVGGAQGGKHSGASGRPSVRGMESPLDSQVNIPLPEGGRFSLTRRQLLIGAGVVGVAAAGIGVASVVAGGNEEDVSTLEVSGDAVFTLDDIPAENVLDGNGPMQLEGEYQLPYGTLVWATPQSTCAACLLPTDSASPLTQVGLLSLSDGTCTTVLDGPASQENGFDIYEAACDDSGVIWTEANCLTGQWRVYQATHSGTSIGSPVLVDQGESEYEIPSIAVAGGKAFWQVLPDANGTASAEDSLLKAATFGQSDVAEMWRSTGRMSTPPYSTGDGIVITPRLNTSGVYHQITLIDAASGQMMDSLTLPASMKPLEAGYVNGRFTFSFDGWYSYGDGISQIGTYVPVDEEGVNGGQWFRFGRTPTAAPAWAGPYLIVKSTMSVAGVDVASRTMFTIECPDGCDDYGEYLAVTGTTDTLVTYIGMPAEEGSDDEGHTLVRVWRYSEA